MPNYPAYPPAYTPYPEHQHATPYTSVFQQELNDKINKMKHY
jgi:hypothetical protein